MTSVPRVVGLPGSSNLIILEADPPKVFGPPTISSESTFSTNMTDLPPVLLKTGICAEKGLLFKRGYHCIPPGTTDIKKYASNTGMKRVVKKSRRLGGSIARLATDEKVHTTDTAKRAVAEIVESTIKNIVSSARAGNTDKTFLLRTALKGARRVLGGDETGLLAIDFAKKITPSSVKSLRHGDERKKVAYYDKIPELTTINPTSLRKYVIPPFERVSATALIFLAGIAQFVGKDILEKGDTEKDAEKRSRDRISAADVKRVLSKDYKSIASGAVVKSGGCATGFVAHAPVETEDGDVAMGLVKIAEVEAVEKGTRKVTPAMKAAAAKRSKKVKAVNKKAAKCKECIPCKTSKKYTPRDDAKTPPFKPSGCPLGTIKQGKDGNYIVKKVGEAKRWIKATDTDLKMAEIRVMYKEAKALTGDLRTKKKQDLTKKIEDIESWTEKKKEAYKNLYADKLA